MRRRGREGRHAAAGCCWWGDEAWGEGAVGAGGHERGWGHAGCEKGEQGGGVSVFFNANEVWESLRIGWGKGMGNGEWEGGVGICMQRTYQESRTGGEGTPARRRADRLAVRAWGSRLLGLRRRRRK